MFKQNDRVWPKRGGVARRKRQAGEGWTVCATGQVAAEPARREFPDRVEAVSADGTRIAVAIYPDGLTYNGCPLSRSIGWRDAADYELAEGYEPTRQAYGYLVSDPRSQV